MAAESNDNTVFSDEMRLVVFLALFALVTFFLKRRFDHHDASRMENENDSQE